MARTIPDAIIQTKTFRSWLRAWWEKDYSVDGAAGVARWLPGELKSTTIEFAGKSWFPIYCPPVDLEGNRFEQFPHLQLPTFNDRYFLERARSGSAAVRLSGAMINGIEAASLQVPIDINIDDALLFSHLVISSSNRTNVNVLARGTLATGNLSATNEILLQADFSSSDIFGDVDLNPARNSSVKLEGANIGGRLKLSGTLAAIDASGITVGGTSLLASLRSLGRLQLDKAKFRDDVEIRSVEISSAPLNIAQATFSKNLSIREIGAFAGIEATKIRVRGDLQIAPNARIKKCQLSESEIAGSLSISGEIDSTDLRSINVGSASICAAEVEYLRMDDLKSRGTIQIDRCRLKGSVVMNSAIFSDTFVMTECNIVRGIVANDTHFVGHADFSGTTLGLVCNFRRAKFDQGATFASRATKEAPIETPSTECGKVDFREVKFGSAGNGYSVEFSGRKFKGRANFEEAIFLAAPYFERDSFSEDVSFRAADFVLPVPASSRSWPLFGRQKTVAALEAHRQNNDHIHLAERAYSNLKNAMSSAGNVRAERQFHTRELRCRRRRSDKEVGFSEKAISLSYDVISEYGESIRKPAIWLLVLPLAFSATYFALGGDISVGAALESLNFSLQQIFRPFYVWGGSVTDSAGPSSWENDALFAADGPASNEAFWEVVIKSLASLESVASLTIGFLLALAVRRRFQVQ